MLYTVCREVELGEGQKLLKEVAGRRVLFVRKGGVFAMDAQCFHMGANLWEGDLEDIGGHSCVVCPAHRYRIDVRSGHKVDTDLCGGACTSKDQKQRTYQVYSDGHKIQVYIPDALPPQLPSDKYNYWGVQQAMATPRQQAFGLFGSPADGQQQPPTPPSLEPCAGAAVSPEPQQHLRGQAAPQGQIQFRAARARAAILANYKPPPMVDQPAATRPSARGLFGGLGTADGSSSASRGLGGGLSRQPLGLAGPQDMEMD